MKKLTRILLLMALVLTMSAGLNGCGPFVIGDEDNPVEPAPQPDPDEPVAYDPVELLQEAQEEGSLISFTYTVDGVERVATFKRVGKKYILQQPADTRATEDEDDLVPYFMDYDYDDDDLNDDDDDDGGEVEEEFENADEEDGNNELDEEDEDLVDLVVNDEDWDEDEEEWDEEWEGDDDEDEEDNEVYDEDWDDDNVEGDDESGEEEPNQNARAVTRAMRVAKNSMFGIAQKSTGMDVYQAYIDGGVYLSNIAGGRAIGLTGVITVNNKKSNLTSSGSTYKIKVKGVKSKTKKLTIAKGKKNTLQVKVLPTNAKVKSVKWKSKNSKVAKVSKNGKGKGKNVFKCTLKTLIEGKATITCTINYKKKVNGKKKVKTTIKVTVKNAAANTVTLSSNNKTLNVGNTFDLKATVAPKSASQKVTWSSSDENVIKINNMQQLKCQIQAMGEGTATITAKHTSGNTATCTVTVNKKAGTISFGDPTTVKRFMTDGKTFTKEVGKTGDGEVKYSSSDTNVATVNETTGEVTIKGAGSTTISATVTDSKEYTYKETTATYTLNVSKQEGTIKFNDNVVSAVYGGTAPTNSLTNTGDGKVTYSVSPAGVAAVDATTGAVTILGAGETTITATVTDGTNYTYATKTATYTLKVEAKDATISFGLDPNQVPVEKLNTDDRFTIAIQTNTGDGKVKYSSLNTNVATVNETTGEVTITGVGETTITATVTEAKNYKYATPSVSYKLKVTAAPSNLGKPNNYEKGGNPFK